MRRYKYNQEVRAVYIARYAQGEHVNRAWARYHGVGDLKIARMVTGEYDDYIHRKERALINWRAAVKIRNVNKWTQP